MRLVRVHGAGTGLILEADDDRHILDIAAAGAALGVRAPAISAGVEVLFEGEQQSWLPMITQWPQSRETLRSLAELAFDDIRHGRAQLPLYRYQDTRLDPPLPEPAARIFAMGGNFAAHASQMSDVMDLPESITNATPQTAPPWGFYVIPGTIVGPDAGITPPVGTKYLDYEAEVAVVLGNHQPGAEPAPVWGYTAWNDFSIRDAALGVTQTDHGPLTWSLTKNFRSGNSCGPWMVVNHPPVDNLSITCLVNGELRQSGNTVQMTHSFTRIASYISDFVSLGAGDMIVSGTPAGTAMERGFDGDYLQDGDKVAVVIDGVDALTNSIHFAG